MDYSSLLTTVEGRLNRSDLSSLMDGFIEQVESEANSYLAQHPVRPMIDNLSVNPAEEVNDLPYNFIDMIEVTASDGTETWPLARVSPGKQFEYYADRALVPGAAYDGEKPQQYRILGASLVLSQAPSGLTLSLDYYSKIEGVSSDNATNWLMDSHPDVYLFGVLAHSFHHLQAWEQSDRYRDLFLGALDVVSKSYPERPRDIGRRETMAPWSASCGVWNA